MPYRETMGKSINPVEIEETLARAKDLEISDVPEAPSFLHFELGLSSRPSDPGSGELLFLESTDQDIGTYISLVNTV